MQSPYLGGWEGKQKSHADGAPEGRENQVSANGRKTAVTALVFLKAHLLTDDYCSWLFLSYQEKIVIAFAQTRLWLPWPKYR